MIVSIYAKGFIKNELLGQATFLVYELVQEGTDLHLFDDPEVNRPAWYPLMKAQRGASTMDAQQQQQDATLYKKPL